MKSSLKKEAKTTSFLSENVELTGKLNLKGGIRIDGKITGEIISHSTIFIGDTARVNAEIVGESLISSGYVKGDINTANLVQLNSPGTLEGDVRTCNMSIEEGSYFNGKCQLLVPQHNQRPKTVPPTPPRIALSAREKMLQNKKT